ncbi:MAG: acetoin dehydrogenase dihydrolipoyllysine-residue acetyltransferase subunit [Chloroflexota bacterium]|nr:acetoin dehydrogenase dihydrolipoyllysine-residue acetyltransferase subunit [Chloroflexota bacterium]
MPTVVTMPKWGLTMTAGTVTNWLADEGDTVAAGAPILTVETEKAVDDVEAPAAGVLRKIVAAAGSEVPVMGAVAVITAAGETLSDDELAALLATAGPVVAAPGSIVAAPAKRDARPATRDSTGRVNASPAARKLAAQLNVDLETVTATGPAGRITSDDVERAAIAVAQTAAAPRTRVVALADGRRIATLIAGPTNSNPPLVFLHGLGGSLTTWTNLLPAFADRYRVIAVDLPGHGGSDKPEPATTDYSLSGLAAAVCAVIENQALAPAVLIGHSLGGAVALQIALDRPKLVRGLVLIDSAGLGPEISPELLDRFEAEPSREETKRLLELFFVDQRLVLDRGVDEMHQARTSDGADAAMKAITAAAFSRDGQRINLESRLAEINRPAHIIWGEHDRVTPLHHAGNAATAIPGAWLDVIEGIGHVPQVEAAAATIAVIDEFLRALPPLPAPPVATTGR